MTKEEYEKLLSSDYWKGYSYSLIKERNFTCEDCGRSFVNERHKLQVHHLVYRDVNPWSYKPEELVVLCRECHEKRHGITHEPAPQPSTYDSGTYSKSYTSFVPSWCNKSYSSDAYSSSSIDNTTKGINPGVKYKPYYSHSRSNGVKRKHIIWGLAALFVFALLRCPSNRPDQGFEENVVTQDDIETSVQNEKIPYSSHKQKSSPQISDVVGDTLVETDDSIDMSLEDTEEYITSASTTTSDAQVSVPVQAKKGKTTSELLDERIHASVVEQAKRAGVSTEGTTSEIQERIIHASVVEQAKRAGVSTEGTTSEIQERIIHASVVEQAKRAGVSTEGTTSEIQERIIHASVVRRAQKAGVSSEGTTSEIQDRIIHASVVKRAQEAGVSTEGTTSEIQDRIIRKSLER